MKKTIKESTLRTLIRKELKKQLNEDHGEQAFYDGDKWNVNTFKEIGLIDVLDRIEALSYEIKNTKRGKYHAGTGGDTLSGLVEDLKSLCGEFDGVISYLDSEIND